MMVTRSSRLLVRLGPVQDGHQLVERGHLQPEVIEPGGPEEVAGGGQQVEELAQRAGVHDQGVALFGAVVTLDPAEHLTVEVDQRRPPRRRRARRRPR